jgi:hypothetical protein
LAKSKSVYILGVEAKDLYNADHLINSDTKGYSTKNTKNYKNALDYSLDLIKTREIYEKVYRNQRFSFTSNGKEFTNRAVVVKFNYSYKEYNKASKNIYVKAGYLYRDVQDKIKDGTYFVNGELICICVNSKITNPVKKGLTDFFSYDEDKQCYVKLKEPTNILTKSELRKYLYKNGFTCNGISFVRDKRSSGSSRVGKCLFIDEKMYKNMLKWEKCGLEISEGDDVDLAAFESYIALPSSSCIDTIEIQPENFLVINDYDSEFEDDVISVEYQDGQLVSNDKKCMVKNSIFDGESIMDESLFADYSDRSMLLLRNRFFKSACFKGRVQKWFEDNKITDVSQLNGFTLAKNINDIKIITTPSSIKYLKFGTLQQWFDNLYTTFGIVKYEKPTHYLDGRMVQCHYQLINTLQLSKNDVEEIVKPSLDYISRIREDPDILRYHIKYPYDDDEEITSLKSKNEIIFKLLGMNSNFSKTKMYYDFRNDLVKSMIGNLKQGHILINGNYSTLLGNGVEMLQEAIGTFKGKSILGVGNIHSKRFGYDKTILGSRSPHICSGNVLLARNVENSLIDTYFDLSNEVVYINSIGENILQRLSGADFDSDTVLLTDNQTLINAAIKNYSKFKVPTCFVSAKKTKRHYTAEDKCDLDIKTGTNKIGEIVNLSQLLNSIMWDNIYTESKKSHLSCTECVENNLEIYKDICILAVMSGIEIDKAKKEFDVNTEKEIKRLKAKYAIYVDETHNDIVEQKYVKPYFFKMITLNNGYTLNPKHKYRYFNTPMDYLQQEINRFNFRSNRIGYDVIPFSDIVKPCLSYGIGSAYYEKKDRIINLIKDLKNEINKLYVDYENKPKEEKEDIRVAVSEIKQECVNYINDISIPTPTMYLILKEIDNKSNKGYARLIFNTLFGTPNKTFFQMIIDNSEKIYKVEENEYGSIQLFDYHFVKTIA